MTLLIDVVCRDFVVFEDYTENLHESYAGNYLFS